MKNFKKQKVLTLASHSYRFSLVALAFVLSASSALLYSGFSAKPAAAASGYPLTPPAQICGDSSVLDGPTTAPAGAVTVPAGDNSGVNFGQTNTTFWFAPGTHTLGTGQFSQIIPGNNGHFIGAPGAVLDGQHLNLTAFGQHATDVTIEYLTIQNFEALNNQGVVNHDSGDGWTIQYNTIRNNGGAALMIGTDNVVRYNCITQNGQYGFNAYEPDGPSNVTLDHNEISYNNTDDWETQLPGCGCTGGGKFWEVTGAVVTNNYVHHNYSVGLWADNNNAGFLIEGNYIFENDNMGIFYETSYNALIRNNTLIRNAHEGGADNPGFPTGAIYISEAGSDSRVATNYNTTLDIVDNYFKDNWGGVVLWENADRYCGSPANTSTGECTRVNPSVVTVDTCNETNIADDPYYDDCRWKTQNVKVHDNLFQHTQSNIGPECTFNNHCGVQAVISNYGTYPAWSPYMGTVVQQAITYDQGNVWSNNDYEGDWRFLPFETGNMKDFATWQAAPYSQDTGSTLSSTITDPVEPPEDEQEPDVNSDTSVNVLDLSAVLSSWKKPNDEWTNNNADINNDTVVNELDRNLILSNWDA